MTENTHVLHPLAVNILDRLQALVEDAEAQVIPLEVDPYRSQLFELFVTAEGAGFTAEESEPDLTADGVCKALASRWNLNDEARESTAHQKKLSPEALSKMRVLWTVMRMWMEWSYAWERWAEFHPDQSADSSSDT